MIDPQAVLVATLAGLLLGTIVLGHIAALPTYASAATPGEVGRIIGAAGVVIGLVFYLGQAVIDRSTVDHLTSQLANWFAYSIGIGIGCYLRLIVDEAQRKEAIQTMAERQVDEESRDG
jgi:xanthine/uracil/vitamin C permease (AzgA family)